MTKRQEALIDGLIREREREISDLKNILCDLQKKGTSRAKPFRPPRVVKTIEEMNADVRHAIREDPKGLPECLRMMDSDYINEVNALKHKNRSSFYGLEANNPDKPCRAMREGHSPQCGDLPGMAPEGKCYFDHQKNCNAGCLCWEGNDYE